METKGDFIVTNKYLHILKITLKYILLYYIFESIPIFALSYYYIQKYKHTISNSKQYLMVQENLYSWSIVFVILALLLYYLCTRYKENNIFKKCRFSKINKYQLLYSILTSICLVIISFSIVILLKNITNSYSSVLATNKIILKSYSGIFYIILFGPIIEEIVFRGLIFNEMKSHLSLTASIVLQGVVFGLYHANIVHSIYATIAGIFYAMVYNYTASIIASILCHIFYNIIGSFILPHILIYLIKFQYFIKNIAPFMVVINFIAVATLILCLIKLKKYSTVNYVNAENSHGTV